MALETASSLLEDEEDVLPSAVGGGSGALRRLCRLSLWWPDDLLEDAMAVWPCAGGGAMLDGAHGGGWE